MWHFNLEWSIWFSAASCFFNIIPKIRSCFQLFLSLVGRCLAKSLKLFCMMSFSTRSTWKITNSWHSCAICVTCNTWPRLLLEKIIDLSIFLVKKPPKWRKRLHRRESRISKGLQKKGNETFCELKVIWRCSWSYWLMGTYLRILYRLFSIVTLLAIW